MSKLLLIVQRTYAFSRKVLQIKKQNAILIKDFYNDKGALHRGEKVVIEEKAVDGTWVRVTTETGGIFTIPRHILKLIA